MGRYTEALRKIEEERVKQIPTARIVPHSFPVRNYVLGISIFTVVVIIIVYAYGVYNGSQHRKKQVMIDLPAVSPVHQVSNADQNTLLLENVEKMLQLSTQGEKPALKTEVNTDLKQPITSNEIDFYTIQLTAYNQEPTAELEARKLLEQGYQPLVLRGSKFFKVCVGKFPTKEAADFELQKIKATTAGRYQDAFIRLVKSKNN